jgi:DNA repair photolyase
MELKIVEVPTIKEPIRTSPGFEKKGLSESKLDLCALCQFGCAYCSSNTGNYLRINRDRFAELARQQIGQALGPMDDPYLMYVWPDVLARLEEELARHDPTWGAGHTLVFSMLTDGFSPYLVKNGITEKALRLVLERTSFRIRVLSKNALVGSDYWVQFFKAHTERFIVGLSIGTTDDAWAKCIEIGTSLPSARLRALTRLQDAGVSTYGMLCPIFPDVLEAGALENLVDAVRPERVEHVWAEPFNDRLNWQKVRDGYPVGSPGYRWLTEVYQQHRRELWSRYATELYVRLRDKGHREGWLPKLRYLLYEDGILSPDTEQYRGLEGVWLQSSPAPDGKSRHPGFAALQMDSGCSFGGLTRSSSRRSKSRRGTSRRNRVLLERPDSPPALPFSQSSSAATLPALGGGNL